MSSQPAAYVLDASAVLALLKGEAGSDVVEGMLDDSEMSSLNWSEVLQRYQAEGLTIAGRRDQIESLGIALRPFDARQAELTAGLYSRTLAAGLSIGDRACLALALDLGAEAVSADRAWADLDIGVAVRLIR